VRFTLYAVRPTFIKSTPSSTSQWSLKDKTNADLQSFVPIDSQPKIMKVAMMKKLKILTVRDPKNNF
jgi:hypothetical protein